MKNYLKILSLTLIGLLTFSCSSSDDNETPKEILMSATINGQKWSTWAASASIQEYGNDEHVLGIVAAKTSNNSSIIIQIPITDLTIGTHNYNTESDGLMAYTEPAGEPSYSSSETGSSFSLTITAIDYNTGKISGTFSATLHEFEGDGSVTITNGKLNNVELSNAEYYTNGSMTLTRNSGTTFTMDSDTSDSKFLMISQNSISNGINLLGNNLNVSSDFGIYNISFPKNVTSGTYDLTANSDFGASIPNAENQAEYNLTSGSLTITSHTGNNIVGTFNFTMNNGSETITITNGSFNITHK